MLIRDKLNYFHCYRCSVHVLMWAIVLRVCVAFQDGRTALHLAVYCKRTLMARMIMKRAVAEADIAQDYNIQDPMVGCYK